MEIRTRLNYNRGVGEVLHNMTAKGMMRPMVAVFFIAAMAVLPSVCLRAAAPPSAAQQDQGTSFNLEGKINDLSPGKLTVSSQDNMIFHVTYDDKTEIHRKDGTAGSSKDLAAGEQIKVQGELTPAGVVQARRIDLE